MAPGLAPGWLSPCAGHSHMAGGDLLCVCGFHGDLLSTVGLPRSGGAGFTD